MMGSKFWVGKKVFVTGHTGFKGGWLCLLLREAGADVCGFALPPVFQEGPFVQCDLANRMDSIEGDVRDSWSLRKAVQSYRPDVVFHLAAQPLVRESYRAPNETYMVNVLGAVNTLEAVRLTPGVGGVVMVTSDKCYEEDGSVWSCRETAPLGGPDPYSSSKACCELVTDAYRRSFFGVKSSGEPGVGVATARAGNVIGGGDWSVDRLVPDVLRALLKKERVSIRNPGAVRPWQHVLDALNGYLMLGEQLYLNGSKRGSGWNFGPDEGNEKSVEWMVDELYRLWGEPGGWNRVTGAQPHENPTLRLDSTKAKRLLGWMPKWGPHDALRMTVEWTQSWLAGGDMTEVSRRQIEAYYGDAAVERPAELAEAI